MKRYEKKPLGCGICPYKTNSACHLERHLRIHTGHKPYACTICSYKATDGGLLKRHMRIHSGEKPFTCHICGHKTAQSCSLKDHMAVHTGKKRYSCEFCPFQCSRIGRLRDHKRQHSNREVENEEVSRAKEQNQVACAEETKPELNSSFKCPYCSLELSESLKFQKEFVSNAELVQDNLVTIKKEEGEEEKEKSDEMERAPFVCSLCLASTDSIEALHQHTSLHILYKCLNCKSAFDTPQELINHIRSKELIFKCDFCNFKSRTRNELRGHERMHSNNQPFNCGLCDFVSKSGVEFKQHQITHNTNEIVQCNICFSKFAKTGDLRGHMVSHCTRGKQQAIKGCATEMRKNDNSTVSSYACFYCQFKCTDKNEMEKHIQNLHVVSVKSECNVEMSDGSSVDELDQKRNEIQRLAICSEQPTVIDRFTSTLAPYNWMYDSQMCHFMAMSDRQPTISDLYSSTPPKTLLNCFKGYYASSPWQIPFHHFLNDEYCNDLRSINQRLQEKDPSSFCHFSDTFNKFRKNEHASTLAIAYKSTFPDGTAGTSIATNYVNDVSNTEEPTQEKNENVFEKALLQRDFKNVTWTLEKNENVTKKVVADEGFINKLKAVAAKRATPLKSSTLRDAQRLSTECIRKRRLIAATYDNEDSKLSLENDSMMNDESKSDNETMQNYRHKIKKLSLDKCVETIDENNSNSLNSTTEAHNSNITALSDERELHETSSKNCQNTLGPPPVEKELQEAAGIGRSKDAKTLTGDDTEEPFLIKLRRFVRDSLSRNDPSSSGLRPTNKKVHTIEVSSGSESSDVDELHICVN